MAKESRALEIFRKELEKNGILKSFLSSKKERIKETLDPRNLLLPQTGYTGAISRKFFGKPYRYGGYNVRNVGGGATGQISEVKPLVEKISSMDIGIKIIAKNTMALPNMSRDMNVMRQNVQKLVKISGGKPSTKADAFFTKSSEREALYENQFLKEKGGSKENKKPDEQKSSGSLFGGILGGIGSLFGGAISGIGSIFSSVASFFGSIGGGIISGLASVFSGMGIVGVLLLAGIGFLIKELFRNVNFDELGNAFGDIGKALKNLFTGEGDSNESLIERTKKNWGKLLESVDKVKEQFDKMFLAIEFQIDNMKKTFDQIGGAEGLFGILFGSAIVGKIVSGWITDPKLIIDLVSVLAKNPVLGIAVAGGAAALKIMSDSKEKRKEIESTGQTVSEYGEKNRQAAIKSAGGWSKEKEDAELYNARMSQADELMNQINNMRGDIVTRKQKKNITEADKRFIANQEKKIQELSATREEIINEAQTTNEYKKQEARKGMSAEEVSSESARYRGKAPTPATSTPTTTPQQITSEEQQKYANLIYSKFIEAGFSDAQARGAIANAIAESGLNPNAYNSNGKEESVGLFQLNRKGGVGTGYTVEQLKDPNKNIDLMIAEAKSKGNKFKLATTPEEATRYFMKEVERPANTSESKQQERIANLSRFNISEQIAQTPAATGEQAGPPKPANLAKQEPNKPRTLSDLVFAGINSTFDVLDSIMGPILESINPTNQNQPSSQTPTTSDVQISPDMARNEKMWDTYEKMYLTV